jgi:hypothetical protein
MFWKRLGIERFADQMLASQEGLYSVGLVFIPRKDVDIYNVGNLQISCSNISFDESV